MFPEKNANIKIDDFESCLFPSSSLLLMENIYLLPMPYVCGGGYMRSWVTDTVGHISFSHKFLLQNASAFLSGLINNAGQCLCGQLLNFNKKIK